MIFFAANSVLARLALRANEIDAGTFTLVRILAGALALTALLCARSRGWELLRSDGSTRTAAVLFVYAITFSLAYVSLSAGMGALILFAAVQITMMTVALLRGERPGHSEWAGLVVAFAGLVYLVFPGLTAPSPAGAALMGVSGAGWGLYSVAARGVRSPTAATTGNFVRAAPLAALAWLIVWLRGQSHATLNGLALATISGALTSGYGYIIWYTALKSLSTSRAAIAQLTVPALAAAAGVVFLGERMSWRLAIASVAILGGIAMAVFGKQRLRR